MKRTRTYLIPDVLDDVRIGTAETVLEFRSHPIWKSMSARKAVSSDTPLDRHDFKAKVNNRCNPAISPVSVPVPSAIRAFITALGMGCNNRSRLLEMADIKEVCLKLHGQAVKHIPKFSRPVNISAADVILAAIELGAASSIYRITDYDQLICALDCVGPVLLTMPWYERFLTAEELAMTTGRAEMPWGQSQGLTTVCVSGYSANGILATIEHGQPWRQPTFRLLEEHFVQLASEGEVYAFDRGSRTAIVPTLYS